MNKKTLYIIPGWEDTPRLKAYTSLGLLAKKKGYEVFYITVNWKKHLSKQSFQIENNSIVFGFSLGAILAKMVAQNIPVKHLILGSVTPNYNFTNLKIRKELVKIIGKEFVEDIEKNLKKKNLAKKQTILYGELENEKADIIVPKTEHELSKDYILAVNKLL